MLNAMPFQHHTACIEQSLLHRLEKIFSKFCSKLSLIDVKTIRFTYSECVSLALSKQHTKRLRLLYYHLFRI